MISTEKHADKIHKEEKWQEKILLYVESCLLGIVIGGQLPPKYKKPILCCCASFGIFLSGFFFFKDIRNLLEKIHIKKQEKQEEQEEEGFIMRIVTEE